MYNAFFNFREDPFGASPDPRFFFPSEQHAEAAACLYYAMIQRRGFAVLIGSPGLGKTTILASLAARLAGEARVAFFVHPELQGADVLESVLLAMGLEPDPDRPRRYRQFNNFLLELQREHKTCVVIFDEAQNLSAASLESIRMLSNFETPGRKLIQFVLAGQPALSDVLARPDCEQIRQRVNVLARLSRLNRSQVAAYISHRLEIAGAPTNPFAPEAVRAIASASQGIPRNINTLCFNALTLAFAGERRTVGESIVAEVVCDLELPAPELESSPAPEPSPLSLPISARGTVRFRPLLFAAAVLAIALLCTAALNSR